jgi:hypothetical protein
MPFFNTSQRYAGEFGLPAGYAKHLSYSRQGGVAGLNDRVCIEPDGTIRIVGHFLGRLEGKLSAPETELLENLLKDWNHLPSKRELRFWPLGMDQLAITIKYGRREIIVTIPGYTPPVVIERLIKALDEIAHRITMSVNHSNV